MELQIGEAGRPPGPRGKPLVGSLFDFRRDMLGFLLEAARRDGDVVRFRLGPNEVFLVSHPADIQRLLVTDHRRFMKSRGVQRMKLLLGEGLLGSEGEFHLRQRRLVQPAFHRQRIAEYGETMAGRADRWQARLEEGRDLDVAEEMRALTLAVAGETLFGADLEEETSEIGEAVTAILELFPRILLPFSELLERLPLPSSRRFERERDRLDRIVYRLIDDRRAAASGAGTGRRATAGPEDGGRGEPRQDVLSLLLVAEEEGEGMTDRQVRDEVMTLLLAGHETTATALAWSWHLLSRNPEAEAALHRELDRVLGGRRPTAADASRLPVARRVLAEVMRLYPPAWMVGRRALADWEAGGWRVPEGAYVFASQWVVHHDPRWYPDPWRFDLARWTSEAEAARPRFTYFPFGGGPRLCIGEGFAWMEGVLVLATVARGWRLRPAGGGSVGLSPGVTLRPEGGLRMTPERRPGPARRASGRAEGEPGRGPSAPPTRARRGVRRPGAGPSGGGAAEGSTRPEGAG